MIFKNWLFGFVVLFVKCNMFIEILLNVVLINVMRNCEINVVINDVFVLLEKKLILMDSFLFFSFEFKLFSFLGMCRMVGNIVSNLFVVVFFKLE